MTAPEQNSKTHLLHNEQKAVLRLYAAIVASLLLTFIPNLLVALISLVLFSAALIACYILRHRAEPNSLTENHMTYLIRTIWIVSLIALITVVAASIYMLGRVDLAPLLICSDNVAAQLLNQSRASIATLSALLQPCIDDFIHSNRQDLLISTLLAAAPAVFYLVYRIGTGLSRALKGYRIANPKIWL